MRQPATPRARMRQLRIVIVDWVASSSAVSWATVVVAITSVVSSAGVAFAVTLISGRNERERDERQRLDARRDELRQLLDGSVQHLFRGYDLMYTIDREDSASTQRLRQLGEQLTEETWLIAQHGLRVGLRVPAGTPLGKKQRHVNRIFLEYDFKFRNYLENVEAETQRILPPPPHREAFKGIRALVNEIRSFVGVVEPLEMQLIRGESSARGSSSSPRFDPSALAE
jgi:hypothetical protein